MSPLGAQGMSHSGGPFPCQPHLTLTRTPPQGTHQHESYMGDRTKEALVQFADSLVPSAGMPHHQHGLLVVRLDGARREWLH